MVIVWIFFLISVGLYFEEPIIIRNLRDSDKSDIRLVDLLPTIVCLWTLLYCKIMQEVLLTSVTIVAEDYFGWSGIYTGFYLAILNFMVIPVHFLVGYLALRIRDRTFILLSVTITTLASFLQISYGPDVVPEGQYIVANILIFLSTNVTDGTSNSLLSKMIPYYLTTGIFNAGFTATMFGTVGRFIGNIAVSLAGMRGVRTLENYLFIPLTFVSLVTVVFVLVFYRCLLLDLTKRKSN
jgi:MFS family permease